MTSLEKSIKLGYLFLSLKPKTKKQKNINTCTTFCCMYWYVSIYSEECFWPQYIYPKLSSFNGYRWCPLGKFSHLVLEQLFYQNIIFLAIPNIYEERHTRSIYQYMHHFLLHVLVCFNLFRRVFLTPIHVPKIEFL